MAVLPAFLTAVAAATLAAGVAHAATVQPAATKVVLKDIAFHAATTRIHPRQRVTFVWKDGPYTPHNVHSVGTPRFAGASDRKTGSYTVRFTKRGTYRFECTIHPNMTGKIVVK